MGSVGPVEGAGYGGGIQGPSPQDKKMIDGIIGQMDSVVHNNPPQSMDQRIMMLQNDHDSAVSQMQQMGFPKSAISAMDEYLEQSMRMVDGRAHTPALYDGALANVEAKVWGAKSH